MNIYKCHYGCGQDAIKQNKSGNWMCSNNSNSCPINRKKNSLAIKAAHDQGKIPGWNKLVSDYGVNRAWSKGLTKETNQSVKVVAEKNKGRRFITDEDRLKKIEYREECAFQINDQIENIKGFELLKQYGMYHKVKNKDGVVRDHRISIDFGFNNNIDPYIISHPANCEFLFHKDNARKTRNNSCTLEHLIEEIENWGL